MKQVLLIQDEINGRFVAILDKPQPTKKELKNWALKYILDDSNNSDYNDIGYWEGGSIDININSIVINGDNGGIFLETKIVELTEI